MLKKNILFSVILTLLPMFFCIFIWNSIPDEVPSHFNYVFKPDGWSKKGEIVFELPILVLYIQVILIYFITKAISESKSKDNRLAIAMLWVIPLLFNIVFFLFLYITLNNNWVKR
ncbi:DUF1648 domain-containing protein [Enterococcus faecalis]|uniref:DUF1648 domain-containing protein n=1 Tax=Enterococcus faecalis TaxID=1351 RepID=UPI001574866B|nr:DUF1648 domain-containing protein [Enterococcus faecalis]NSQ65132.1 DUF1648 domain-containing protein [Enterococcus faecalis]